MKAQHQFTVAEWKHAAKMGSQRGRCNSCENEKAKDVRLCSVCKERLNDTKKKCKKCSKEVEKRAPAELKRTGVWLCIRNACKKNLPKEHFSLWMKEKNKQYKDMTQVCNQCFVKDKQKEKEQNVDASKHVQKHHSEPHSKKK